MRRARRSEDLDGDGAFERVTTNDYSCFVPPAPPPQPPPQPRPQPATVSFEQQVHPVLVAKCKACHRSASHVFRVTGNASDDLPFAQAQATPADLASSTLLQKATGNDHRGGTRIRPSDPEYGTILTWIQQGAR